MIEPVYLQYPFAGGVDEKTAEIYLDAENNQADIANGNFTNVGVIDHRKGIQGQLSLTTALVLNPNGITVPYRAPSGYSTPITGFGNLVLQNYAAWNGRYDSTNGASLAYVGSLPNASVVRRPMPIQSKGAPVVCDGVAAIQGTVRAAAWIGQDSNAGQFNVYSAFVDPDTSEGLLANIEAINLTADDVQIVNLIWFAGTGTLALFLAVTAGGSRTLNVYSLIPANSSLQWAPELGATLNLYANSGTSLDVQPFKNDPSNGYIVMYLPSGVSTQFSWKYFSGTFVGGASGTLTAGTQPGLYPCFIVADWAVDVVFAWSDISGSEAIYISWFSGDGLFTSLANLVRVPSTWTDIAGFPFSTFQLGGICRLNYKTNATLDSEIYISFWTQDVTYAADGGPRMPYMKGGILARSSTTTITAMGFAYYPPGLLPISRPAQPTDALQSIGNFVHVVHPCVQQYYYISTFAAQQADDAVSLQCTEYLIDYRCRAQPAVPLAVYGANTNIVATVAPRQIDAYTDRWTNFMHLMDPASADGSTVFTPISVSDSGVSGISQDIGTCWMANFTFAPTFTVSTINNTNQVSGAVPTRFYASGESGASVLSEHGFTNYPEFVIAQTTGTGLTGTYSYAVGYARQDANGNIERSAPVEIKTPITLTNQSAKIIFPLLSWWATKDVNPDGYMVEIYRTLNLGGTYYCVARLLPSQLGSSSSVLLASYTDNLADSVLKDAEVLPTTGGLLDSVNPPSANLQCAHGGRLAIVDETLRRVWFTKAETEGEVLGFNEVLISTFPEGGDITAIASMDDKFVVFKQSSIWLQFGDGPADNGQNGDWTIPRPVPTDVGCISAASAQLIPAGVVFQASSGIHLLSRDAQVIYIGKNVQTTLQTYPKCVSSTVVPSAKQVRWCMEDGSGNQIIVVYDYLLNQWTKHTYDHLDSKIVALYMADDVYTVLTLNGSRYVESGYLDKDISGTSYFVANVPKTPWIKIQGVQGYLKGRHIIVKAKMNDPCGVRMDLAFNYDPTVRKSKTFTYQNLQASNGQALFYIPAEYNKAESIQVTLYDVDSSSKVTGQGMTFESIGLSLQKIGDTYRRIPATVKG